MNMKKLITLTAMATTMIAIGAGTFESIPFNLPTYSEEDPLGAKAITNVTQTIVVIQENVTTASNAAAAAQTAAEAAQTTATTANNKATALETTIAETVQKGQLTNDVVIVGNAKGANGAGMESTTTSIVFAVNRDIDELDAENGEILFAADKVRFNVGLAGIWFGDTTLQAILANAGQGEPNEIVGISTNGVAITPDENRRVNLVIPSPGEGNLIESITTNGVSTTINNKTVDITIPAPGDANVIESITTNGVALPINGKTVDIPLGDYVKLSDLQDGITFDTMSVSNLTVNGKQVSLEGHTHQASDIEGLVVGESNTISTISTNGVNVAPDENRNVNIVIPSPGEMNVITAITTNGVATTIDNKTVNIAIPDVSGFANATDIATRNQAISDAAQAAITGINDAQDIATIKSTLTNFLQQLVIPAP